MHLLGIGQEHESVSELFAVLDTDGDGTISREEFIAGFDKLVAAQAVLTSAPVQAAAAPAAETSADGPPTVVELHGLCSAERIGALERYFAAGGDPNGDADGDAPMLVYAAEANKIRVVELLLKQTELDVNAVDSQLNTALVYSAWKGNDEIVSMLLQHPNVEVDFRGLGAYTAIASAVEGGFAGQIQQCIDAGGNLNLPGSEEFNPSNEWPDEDDPSWRSPTRMAHDGQQIECLVVLVANGGNHDELYELITSIRCSPRRAVARCSRHSSCSLLMAARKRAPCSHRCRMRRFAATWRVRSRWLLSW